MGLSLQVLSSEFFYAVTVPAQSSCSMWLKMLAAQQMS